MYQEIIETITSDKAPIRNRSEAELLSGKTVDELLRMVQGLEVFRHSTTNLYHRVRACLFIYAIYRFYLMGRKDVPKKGIISFEGIKKALDRKYDEAIEIFHASMMSQGCNEALMSGLADAYYHLAFEYLSEQVKLSISQSRGNQCLFTNPSLDHYPFRVPKEFTIPDEITGLYPAGVDRSPVRADPSHSGWSDIFFLGMDFPEGARVINISVDLGINGETPVRPPIECYSRIIEKPVIRLVSVDLKCSKDVDSFAELFNFGNDHLGLLKAGVIASGLVPVSFEKSSLSLQDLLKRAIGKECGIELVTYVRGTSKGSRLAVSTTLLCAIITRLMRFTGQMKNTEGTLNEEERRLVASRAILGEWLGGSGGGWQDSGGIWPGIKVIEGVSAIEGDPEYGVSRGRLLPKHLVLAKEQLPKNIEKILSSSIVMVHGGISQNVGPILEMVTAKYLLRYSNEWKARLGGIEIFDRVVESVKVGAMKDLGHFTTLDWEKATKVIVPWASTAFTEDLVATLQSRFGKNFWGFLMLGGMSGGGMAFIVNPDIHDEFIKDCKTIMQQMKERYKFGLPFAMEPVVYDFAINYQGIVAQTLRGVEALMPSEYYETNLLNAIQGKSQAWAKEHQQELSVLAGGKRRSAGKKLNNFSLKELSKLHQKLFHVSVKKTSERLLEEDKWEEEVRHIKKEYGFDEKAHEEQKRLLKSGKLGVDKNRISSLAVVEDARDDEVIIVSNDTSRAEVMNFRKLGLESLYNNEVAVVTFSGGTGTRWTEGAATVKALNPFVMMNGRHRNFAEIHLAKSRRVVKKYRVALQHVFTTSYLTHEPLRRVLEESQNYDHDGPVYLSRGLSIGHRVYPMERDLRYLWEELSQQVLQEQSQKVLLDLHEALIEWARSRGEGEDYTENVPIQRFNPPGHWYEIPNLFKNGVLGQMLLDNPNLKYLMAHNIDTMGAFLSPILIGMHISLNKPISFEVTPRRYEDKGGGLARVNGKPQLLESLAFPREEDEFKLSYYNTLTNWITIDGLLKIFNLTRADVINVNKDSQARKKVYDAVYAVAEKVPTYVTIKDTKLYWGAGQEDVFPVAQFEKLWGCMSGLDEISANFFVVERRRGQQLKDPAQLDAWVTEGSRDYVAGLADFEGTGRDPAD